MLSPDDRMGDYISRNREFITKLSSLLDGAGFNYTIGYKNMSGISRETIVVCYVLWYAPTDPNSQGITAPGARPMSEISMEQRSDDAIISAYASALENVPAFSGGNYSVNDVVLLYSQMADSDINITSAALGRYGIDSSETRDFYNSTISQWIKVATDSRYSLHDKREAEAAAAIEGGIKELNENQKNSVEKKNFENVVTSIDNAIKDLEPMTDEQYNLEMGKNSGNSKNKLKAADAAAQATLASRSEQVGETADNVDESKEKSRRRKKK